MGTEISLKIKLRLWLLLHKSYSRFSWGSYLLKALKQNWLRVNRTEWVHVKTMSYFVSKRMVDGALNVRAQKTLFFARLDAVPQKQAYLRRRVFYIFACHLHHYHIRHQAHLVTRRSFFLNKNCKVIPFFWVTFPWQN